jgi:hypothetical protein
LALPSFEQVGTTLKNHINQRFKNQVKKKIASTIANHFAGLWWVYAIIVGIALLFYLLAAAISTSASVSAGAMITEKFLPPQMYVADLEKVITSPFGERTHPVTGEEGSFHTGIDMGLPSGTPVSSSTDGVVKKVSYPKPTDPESSKNAGIYVEIESSVSDMPGTTRYLHLENALVTTGQTVKKGQIIGLSGNTGRSTGPHLHYELQQQDLQPTDPIPYIMMMSKLVDVASEEAFKNVNQIEWSDVSGFDFRSNQMLYISNVYLETKAPKFSEQGIIYTRDMNTGGIVGSGGGVGGGGNVGPPIIVPTTFGNLTHPFFLKWAPYAMAEERRSGVKASVTLAQAALESNYGVSPICNNVFGIKANSSWYGPSCSSSTSEQDAGGSHQIVASFRSYSSFAESFADHSNFLLDNPRYDVGLSKKNPFEFANELQRATYATDWQYANKLKNLMFNQNLISLDRDRGIDPSTGETWKDVPWVSSTPPPSGGSTDPGSSPPTPTPGVVNDTESITVFFGIEQLYGTYAREVHRSTTTTTKPSGKKSASTTSSNTSTTGKSGSANNNYVTNPPSGRGGTDSGTITESTETVSYTNLTDSYTGKPIINLVNYNSVLNYYQGRETQAPSIYIKDIPNAIAVTLESNGKDDLRVSQVEYIKGQY